MGAGDLEPLMRILSVIAFFLVLSVANAGGFLGRENSLWLKTSSTGKEEKLEGMETRLTFPGSQQVFTRRAPAAMRLSKDDFEVKNIQFKLSSSGDEISPKILFFVTDKDGSWYQSQKEYTLKANAVTTIKVPLDTFSQAMRPVGHRASWNAQSRIMTADYGLNIYSSHKGNIKLKLLSVEVEKQKNIPKLQIIDWQMPEEIETLSGDRRQF